MTTIHPQRHVLSHDTNSELCAPGRKVQQWSMIKPARAEAKFTWVCLCSAGTEHRDVRFSVHFCGWVSLSKLWPREKDREKQKHHFSVAIYWPLYLVYVIVSDKNAMLLAACYSGSWRLIRYEKASLGQLRKAGEDIIEGMCRIWSKKPNNKVTSFAGNSRKLPSCCCQHCFPGFICYCINGKGNPEKELRQFQSTCWTNIFHDVIIFVFWFFFFACK